MIETDNKKKIETEFSFPIHTCKVCGFEACSLKELNKHFSKSKNTKIGYHYKCKSCHNEYIREWNKNNPYHMQRFNNLAENKIKRRINKRVYDKKNRFRTKLQRHSKAYAHIMKIFDKEFPKHIKSSEIDIKIPFDKVIKSYTYFTGILYDLITYYLEEKGLNFDLYFYPYDSKDKALYFFIKLK